jgi:hypothetical protein
MATALMVNAGVRRQKLCSQFIHADCLWLSGPKMAVINDFISRAKFVSERLHQSRQQTVNMLSSQCKCQIKGLIFSQRKSQYGDETGDSHSRTPLTMTDNPQYQTRQEHSPAFLPQSTPFLNQSEHRSSSRPSTNQPNSAA